MPNELYLVRLIHNRTGRSFPGERLWTADQLLRAPVMRFLRVRNSEGCDVYIQPYAANQNAGYILVDLDRADSTVVDLMRANGHDPCVVLQTSPGHLQSWIRISTVPVEPAVATAIGRHLARTYGGDLASTDWRHLGRLAGFTNQKPQRRTDAGYAPWVRILHARAGLAPDAQTLIENALQGPAAAALPINSRSSCPAPADALGPGASPPRLTTAEAAQVYRDCVQRWQVLERFPQPDWSIVDLWVVRELLRQGRPVAEIEAVVRLASPHFPRGHGNPEDYLRRTFARAAFPAPGGAVCALRITLPLTLAARNQARPKSSGQPRPTQDSPATQPTREPGNSHLSEGRPAAGTQRRPTADAPLQNPSRGQSLILADQVLNRLAGYARKGTRARRDFYQNDLDWLADVCLRLQTSEPDPLRPAGW
jgi:hypothetical protein